MNKNKKRVFIPGDEWIYFKIYCGVKTADLILIDHLKKVLEKLVDNLDIDQWFFLRYSDPDFHLRLRLHVVDQSKLINIMDAINNELVSLTSIGLIWKVQLDTYNRELERYGFSIIEESELLFYHDSKMIIGALEIFETNNNLNLKWLWGLLVLDSFMDDFNLLLVDKKDLMENLKTSFGEEMGLDKHLRKQLSKKYQKYKFEIDSFINREVDQELNSLIDLLQKKTDNMKNIIEVIKKSTEGININHLISSHIHMIMNRLFRTKNRQNEFVCYHLLYFYYDSKIAQMKYNTQFTTQKIVENC